jgi:hypothetical protein
MLLSKKSVSDTGHRPVKSIKRPPINTSISGESAARTKRAFWSLKQCLPIINERLAWVIGSGILVITILETNLMNYPAASNGVSNGKF